MPSAVASSILGASVVAADTFSLTPNNGFTLVLIASAYAIGRWWGGLSALIFALAMQTLGRPHMGGSAQSEDFRSYLVDTRSELEFVCGTLLGAFYLGFWFHGYRLG
jgi:hypothetical protein